MMEITADILTLAAIVGIWAFLWKISGDMRKEIGELRERMARLEGLFEGFTNQEKGK
ncbi:MAG: hypothetical protein OXC82_13810 [Rhodobacteraceae bacterium]|nr:hypothetical protein [Paracoccaceae bacterium]MCY4251493.1 hypothetical protein [Paracoccaceae bacterium]